MRLRDIFGTNPVPPAPAPEANAPDTLAQMRQEADELCASGEDIIQRVLSGDSEAYNLSNRQQGGQ